jgi:hypothetical protein
MKLQEYEELVMKHRPHLKPISAHTYAVSLKSIEPEGSENAKWIEDTKYVLWNPDQIDYVNIIIIIFDNRHNPQRC